MLHLETLSCGVQRCTLRALPRFSHPPAEVAETDPYLDDISAIMRNAGDDILVRVHGQRERWRAANEMHPQPAAIHAGCCHVRTAWWGRTVARDPARHENTGGLDQAGGTTGVAKTLIASGLDRFQEPNLWTFSPEDAVVCHTTSAPAPFAESAADRVMPLACCCDVLPRCRATRSTAAF